MVTVSDIINKLGGNATAARALNLGQSTVSEFKRRNSIPPRYWRQFVNLGITADELIDVHEREAAQ